jgi:hypothetical protein
MLVLSQEWGIETENQKTRLPRSHGAHGAPTEKNNFLFFVFLVQARAFPVVGEQKKEKGILRVVPRVLRDSVAIWSLVFWSLVQIQRQSHKLR